MDSIDRIQQIEQKERLPELLFKVTLMRHEEPFYKDIGHDLTPIGIERSIARGKRFKEEGTFSDNDEVFLIHSPKPRAKGTLDFVAEGAELESLPKTQIDQLRSSDVSDREAFMKRLIELHADTEKMAKDHFENEMFQSRPDIIETNDHKSKRLYRSFEYLIRWFDKYPVKDKTPHVIAVSHFEVITNIIDDVFGIENMKSYNSPNFGESVYIEVYSSNDIDKLLLKVNYNEYTKNVLFNRKNRSIELI